VKKIKGFFTDALAGIIVVSVALLCLVFIVCGNKAEDGSITLDGTPAQIEDYTKDFIEDANATLYRIMNEDKPTDEETIKKFLYGGEDVGLGNLTSLDQVIARRKADGDNDGGNGWQCSKYTSYLATGRKDYSSAHPDYGPVNGKDVAAYLVRNFGWEYIDKPVAGAIGSGGFNTLYGHTAQFLYMVRNNIAMVSDANYVPLTVSTHEMDITGWVWVVPGDYEPEAGPGIDVPTVDPAPAGDITHVVRRGETLGGIILGYGYSGKIFGDDGKAQAVADDNGILDRGLIYPNQQIWIRRDW